ncbi:hypothetical protein GCM10023231_03210 [Olivibacter ginsenosidimutans]|uniref:Glycoside hydrolase family 42 N-terminal domain-containing protein n=1 Tax=Olivibacter ginsenosidimutans TaxID=1176537 RepID=A0ABP9AE73_9SPHI
MKTVRLFLYSIIYTLVWSLNSCNINPKKLLTYDTVDYTTLPSNKAPFRNFLGINGFEWDFIDSTNHVSAKKYGLIKSFDRFRHYLDWERIEPQEGIFRFDHSPDGGWSYDEIYKRCAEDSLTMLVTLQIAPKWLIDTYPESERQRDVSLLPYGKSRLDPLSYIAQAKAAFQLTARYGRNKRVNPKLIHVKNKQNRPRIGLGYVKYVECGNEPDKWWKGPSAQQSAEEYAANLSAFYDGHKGTLGKDVGVKTADPSMQVVMGGMAKPDVDFLKKIVAWCRKNRGFKPDGQVDLCFDIINYHNYSNKNEKIALAPELSNLKHIAMDFIETSKNVGNNLDIWVTETGYDLNQGSFQAAFPIGNKPVEEVQADWAIRTSLLYSRLGIKSVFFYMLNDVSRESPVQYASAGFLENDQRRPAANYFNQVKELLGNYHYIQTLNNDPLVDLYQNDQQEKIYVLLCPSQTGAKKDYMLQLGTTKKFTRFTLQPHQKHMAYETSSTKGPSLAITVTETPIFIKLDGSASKK